MAENPGLEKDAPTPKRRNILCPEVEKNQVALVDNDPVSIFILFVSSHIPSYSDTKSVKASNS